MMKPHFQAAWFPIGPTKPPQHLVFYDTETRPRPAPDGRGELHELRIGVALYYRLRNGVYGLEDETIFRHAGEFYPFLVKHLPAKGKVWAICHNLNFDLREVDFVGEAHRHGLYWTRADAKAAGAGHPEEAPDSVDVPFFSHRYKACFLIAHHPKGTIEFLDSLNWFDCSVEKLGARLGKRKLKMPAWEASDGRWAKYCRRDVEVIAEATVNFQAMMAREGFGSLRRTLASTAFAVFRTRFLGEAVWLPDGEGLREWHRQAYYGGRVDVRRLGRSEGPVTMLDVKSLYPTVMVQTKMPGRLLRSIRRPSLGDVYRIAETSPCVAHVHLAARVYHYPVRIDGRVRYCDGRFSTYLAGPELLRACTQGEVVSCERIDVFETRDYFKRYVRYWYDKRSEFAEAGDDVLDYACKILLNSLYGKSGQKGVRYDYVRKLDGRDFGEGRTYVGTDSLAYQEVERFGPIERTTRTEGEARLSHPAVAATVTSAGRVYIDRMKDLVGTAGYLYSDTDSLLIPKEREAHVIASGLLGGSRLGDLAVVGRFPWAEVYGKKDYLLGCRCNPGGRASGKRGCASCDGLGHVWKIKGVRRKAVVLSGEEARRHQDEYETKTGRVLGPTAKVVRQTKFHSLASVWHEGWSPYVRVTNEVKVLSREFTDGTVDEEGNVVPFRLGADLQRLLESDPMRWHRGKFVGIRLV